MKRSIIVVQALALLGACRSEPASDGNTLQSSGGDQTNRQQTGADAGVETPEEARARQTAAMNRVVTPEECAGHHPAGQRCTQVSSRCSGSMSNCASSGDPNVPDRCSGSQWDCQCGESEGELRWDCRQMMHAAGPLAPPELAG